MLGNRLVNQLPPDSYWWQKPNDLSWPGLELVRFGSQRSNSIYPLGNIGIFLVVLILGCYHDTLELMNIYYRGTWETGLSRFIPSVFNLWVFPSHKPPKHPEYTLETSALKWKRHDFKIGFNLFLELPRDEGVYSPAWEQRVSAKGSNWSPDQTKVTAFCFCVERHGKYYQSQLLIRLLRESLTVKLSLILDADIGKLGNLLKYLLLIFVRMKEYMKLKTRNLEAGR